MDSQPSRVSLNTFNGVTWTFYAIALCMALARTIFRFYTFRRLDADDAFLILAILTMTAAVALTHILLPVAFIQNEATLGLIQPGPDFPKQMFMQKNLETAASAMVWVTIYAVKFSYMFFFKKLVRRVRKLQIWWWYVLGVLIPVSLAGSIFDFIICPVFTQDFLNKCPVDVIARRETVWLQVITVFDIVTDVLIISIPAMLIWDVKVPPRAKLGLGLALCLSAFMVCIAIIRISLGFFPNGTSDTVWIYFCFLIEDATAVFMVSTTAFRSTFGQHSKSNSKGSGQLGSKKNLNIKLVHTSPDGYNGNSQHRPSSGGQSWMERTGSGASHAALVPAIEQQRRKEGYHLTRGERRTERDMV